ncbi:glycosyltransferase [Methylobacterium trifolii]
MKAKDNRTIFSSIISKWTVKIRKKIIFISRTKIYTGSISAAIFLQSYLTSKNNKFGPNSSEKLINEAVFVLDDLETVWSRNRATIDSSGIFDDRWYLEAYPELRCTGWDPLDHFTTFCLTQQTSPNSTFNIKAYISEHPELLTSKLHPIIDYLNNRSVSHKHYLAATTSSFLLPDFQELLLESLLFDAEWYSTTYHDGRLNNSEALDAYIEVAHLNVHSPSPFFDPYYYIENYSKLFNENISAIEHYLLYGISKGYRPNPYLDPLWYQTNYPDVADSGLSPVQHYIKYGAYEGRTPSKEISLENYVADHPDSELYKQGSLAHYLTYYWPATGQLPNNNSRYMDEFRVRALDFLSFTIIVRTSSRGNIGRTLESLTRQGRVLFEVIIANDLPEVAVDINKLAHIWLVKPWMGTSSRVLPKILHFPNAVKSAKGSYIIVIEEGDIVKDCALSLLRDAMIEMNADIVYSDEEVAGNGGVGPTYILKPEWSLELLLSYNYFGRITAIRSSLVEGMLLTETTGAACEWDLNLKASERAINICRLPVVLCYRSDVSSLDYNRSLYYPENYKKVCELYWQRQCIAAQVSVLASGAIYSTWQLNIYPRVSVIVPNRDSPDLLRSISQGLLEKTHYNNIEFIIVDNQSTNIATLKLYEELALNGFIIIPYNEEFNYSRACNLGARAASGELLLFLNNDIEIITEDWLEELVRWVQRPGVGIVGAKLLYPNGNIQHAGVALGVFKLAAHIFWNHNNNDNNWGIFGSPHVLRNYTSVTGACHLVWRNVYDIIGGYDESFTLAYSDITFCLDALKAGFKTLYVPYKPLIHHEGASRGSRTPASDQILFAKRLRNLGIDYDPFHHPNLDVQSFIPIMHSSAKAPRVVGQMQTDISDFIGGTAHTTNLDLFDDGAIASIANLNWNKIFWTPNLNLSTAESEVGARILLYFLRRRRDLRRKFPRALSEGSQGGYAKWVKNIGWDLLRLDPTLRYCVDLAFANNFGQKCRQFLVNDGPRDEFEPLIILPDGRKTACQKLFAQVKIGLLSEVAVWWYLLEAAEEPIRDLYVAWAVTPLWQEKVPLGGTVFGMKDLVIWFSEYYSISDDWLYRQYIPNIMSDIDQLKLLFRTDQDIQRLYPQALRDVTVARSLLRYLASPASGQTVFARQWCEVRDENSLAQGLARPGVNVIGHFSYTSGLQISCKSIVAGLEQSGYGYTLRDVPVNPLIDSSAFDFYLGCEVHDKTLIHIQPEPFFDVSYARSGLNKSKQDKYRVAYWYWEFEDIPSSWDKAAFACDEIWTATEFIATGLRKRFTQPVNVLFPGIEISPFLSMKRADFGIDQKEFVFIFSFHMVSVMDRKNPIAVIRSFRLAFHDCRDVSLIIKVSFGDRHPKNLEILKREAKGGKILIIDELYDRDKMLSLVEMGDAYVSLHRSEGLGLSIAEAMLLGIPVVATRYSGNLEFMDDSNSLLVDYSLITLDRDYPPYTAGLRWADPSITDAAKKMRQLYENRSFAKDLGLKGQSDIRKRFNHEVSGQAIVERLQTIDILLNP